MKTTLGVVVITMTLSGSAAAQSFQNAQLSVQEGDKTKHIDVNVRYDADVLAIVDKKGQVLKTFPYVGMKGAEYSYSKSPRWKTAIFVSPLFLFTSGKKHWFLAQGADDFALLRLDKVNYKMVLATFETKTSLTVETLKDEK
jgi:hypothetical protein